MASDLPVIAAALRTPIGEVHGALSGCHPAELLASVLVALDELTALDARQVEQVIVGCAMPVGAQSDIGRAALLAAGWPDTIPSETLAQHSSSSMAALLRAAHAVRSGAVEVVIAAGVEVMSIVPMGAAAMARHAYGKPWGDRVAARYAGEGGLLPDDVRADELARLASIERGAQDAWAQRSHSLARAGRRAHRVAARGHRHRSGPSRPRRAMHERDRRHRRAQPDVRRARFGDCSQPGIHRRRSGRRSRDDASAGDQHGHDAALLDPRWRSCRPRPARHRARRDRRPSSRALTNAAVTVADLDRVELHEGHAAAVLHVIERCGFAVDRVNPDGGSIAIGHPTGVTGGRLITALAHALSARDTVGLAVVEGEDSALATVLERAESRARAAPRAGRKAG